MISGLILCCTGRLHADDALTERLRSFSSKLEALTSTTPNSSDQRQLMEQRGSLRFSEQLNALGRMIAQQDYERAINQLNGLSTNGLPAELSKAWTDLSTKLLAELEERRTNALNEWIAQVDEYARAAHDGCLAAKTSGDLDSLLVRVAALQLRRPANSNDIVAQRANRRLGSVATTLESWMNYLDFKTAGNIKAANNALRSLSTNDSLIPVLRVADIAARIVEEQTNTEAAMSQIYGGIRTINDIAPALVKLAALGKAPDGDGVLNNERRFLDTIEQAKQALDKDDAALTLKVLSTARNFGGATSLAPYREKSLALLEGAFRLRLIQKASGIQPTADEPAVAFEKRVMDTLYGKEDFAALVAVMTALDDASPSTKSHAETRSTLQRFLAARRLESANDAAFAITEYRRVLRANSGSYVPMQQAEDALKRIGITHPELFAPTDSRILAEVEALRQDVQQVLARPSGFPRR
jgi:hypothetical protein